LCGRYLRQHDGGSYNFATRRERSSRTVSRTPPGLGQPTAADVVARIVLGTYRGEDCGIPTSVSYFTHAGQQPSDNVPVWSGQPHKADLSKNSPSMLLSATNEALARLRVSDLTAAASCGPSLFEHTGFCKSGRSRPRHESGATGIGKLENGSRPEAISEIARLRRSLPEPDRRKPRSDQHEECSTTDNHGYRRLDDLRADHDLFRLIAVVVGGNHDAVDAIGLSEEAATRPGLRRWRARLHRDPWFV
jgi:hypothetical protein